jgi:hypothetical protein
MIGRILFKMRGRQASSIPIELPIGKVQVKQELTSKGRAEVIRIKKREEKELSKNTIKKLDKVHLRKKCVEEHAESNSLSGASCGSTGTSATLRKKDVILFQNEGKKNSESLSPTTVSIYTGQDIYQPC